MKKLLLIASFAFSLSGFSQNCTITLLKPDSSTAEFGISYNDTTINAIDGTITIDSVMRQRIGNTKLQLVITNGIYKKLYVLPEILNSPFILTASICKQHFLKRRSIR